MYYCMIMLGFTTLNIPVTSSENSCSVKPRITRITFLPLFPPHHLIDNANVALDDLDYFVADIVGVVGYGDAVIAVSGHADGEIHALQEALLVNAAEDEAGLVEGFGTLGAGADAHCGDGFADGGVEAAFFGQGATVAHHAEGVHLQTVVVVEA